jgi:hypothetical protein
MESTVMARLSTLAVSESQLAFRLDSRDVDAVAFVCLSVR